MEMIGSKRVLATDSYELVKNLMSMHVVHCVCVYIYLHLSCFPIFHLEFLEGVLKSNISRSEFLVFIPLYIL